MLLSLPTTSLEPSDREMLGAFLSSGSSSQDGEPSSGEILGIMKQMKEEMEGDLKELISQEEAAKSSFDELVAAKQKEIAAATKAIEEKTGRVGEVAVELAESKNSHEDAEEQLASDKEMLAKLLKDCELRKKDFEMRTKTRAMEVVALADTIKMLNDDDSLELMKKTLPSAASSLIQVRGSQRKIAHKAVAILKAARAEGRSDTRFDFLELALSGKKVNFDKVIKMIDELIATLGK